MIQQIVIPILGGLNNSYVRGGLLKQVFKHKDGTERDIKGLNIVFLAITALIIFWVEGLSWKILSGTVAMWAAMAPGWGAYVGVLNGGHQPHSEQKWIDWAIKPLWNHPKLWGVAGLTLRGLMVGVCMSISMLNLWFIPLSLLMGPIYLLCMNIPIGNRFMNSWGLSELIFGIALYTGFVL